MAVDRNTELLQTIEPTVVALIAEHRERRKDWYFHEMIPWERGRNFTDEPWDESQCTISPEARTSLVLNLLTEDNLPYYHHALEHYLPETSVWREWSGIWTSEEGQHAIALRSYLLTSRNCDPYELEDDRMATMRAGFHPSLGEPAELFAYTSAQELATRISHRNAGKLSDDPAAFEIMRHVAADENHHFMFYRAVMSALLEIDPSRSLEGIYATLARFQMPGLSIPGFLQRALDMARAGVYNLRIHHDRVLQPLLTAWNVEQLTGLTARAAEIQQKLMELPGRVLQQAERFEKRYAAT
jgi:acyl-[acyl-carrier-protein] desaturase